MRREDSRLNLVESGLPFVLGEEKPIAKRLPGVKGESGTVGGTNKLRILVVEDELLVAESIKEVLLASGYAVVAVLSSGEEVVAQFSRLDPDVVLMDISLSGAMDGIQTADMIHRTLKQVPILFLTAYGETQFPHLSRIQRPLFLYLTKPYHAAQLTECIEKLWNQRDLDP